MSSARRRRILRSAAGSAAWSLAAAVAIEGQTAASLSAVEAFGNFHAAGVVTTITGDVDFDAAVALEWRRAGDAAYRIGHPLVRIDASHFVGSLFFLDPGASWDVRVTLTDPDGVTGPATQSTSVATRPPRLVEPTLRTLYVAPWGDDGNPGTDPGAPLATIQAAADRAQPGDLVSVAAGVYRESVTVPTSGTAEQPIVFRAEPGAILDGADGAIAAGVPWSGPANGVYSIVPGFATGHVVADAGRLFAYANLADLEALPAGPPGGFWFDGTTLRVRFSDGSSPASHAMHVARRENGFYLDGRGQVRIEGFEIRHYGAGEHGKGVYLRYSTECAVRGNDIHEVGAAGVWVKGGERHRIEGNTFSDTSIHGWDWNWTKGSSAENNGVVLTDGVGRGHVIRRNVFQGTFNGIGPCGSAPPPGGVVTTEVDVYENLFLDHNDDALEPEGYCANVRMWDNHVEDVHMAFAVAPAAPGPTWIVRNVAFDFGATRTSQTEGYLASALKINSGYATPIGPLFLYQNTFLSTAPGTAAMTLLNPGESTFLLARNNVFVGSAEALYKVNPVALDWDRDLLHRSTAGRLVYWQGASYLDLAAFQAATGQESDGLSSPPGLVDPGGGDFTPLPASPLVDHALELPGINDRRATADPPDLGAVDRALLFRDGFEEASFLYWASAAGLEGASSPGR